MNDLINMIVNNGVAVVIVAYFIYKDNKFNDTLVKSLTEITTTLKSMNVELSKTRDNTEVLKDAKSE
jgi:hypothetical protein